MINPIIKGDIIKLREAGYSCEAIGRVLNMSRAAVTKYCQRHQIVPIGFRKTKAENDLLTVCLFCGAPVMTKSKETKYCSRDCRVKAWRGKKPYMVRFPDDTQIAYKRLANILGKSDELDAALDRRRRNKK